LFTPGKIAVIVDQSSAPRTAKSARGVAYTILSFFGHLARALDWVPKRKNFFFAFCLSYHPLAAGLVFYSISVTTFFKIRKYICIPSDLRIRLMWTKQWRTQLSKSNYNSNTWNPMKCMKKSFNRWDYNKTVRSKTHDNNLKKNVYTYIYVYKHEQNITSRIKN